MFPFKHKPYLILISEIVFSLFVVACYLMFAPCCIAQPQHNFWYFGRHAGLNFSGGTPVAIYGKTYTHEGTSVVSDASGNLLFYIGSDTITNTQYDPWNIYDASHNYMQNGTGITGNTSTSQGPAIIPKPGSCNRYMIFHVEGSTGGCNQNCGFFYSEVDMTLNGGLGAVIVKNVPIYNPGPSPAVCEQVAITPHANGTDYWVVVHEVGNQNFRVYPVTSTGVGSPLVQSLPPIHPMSSIQISGYAKFNKTGTKLAWGGANSLYLYDFNNATGIISNAQNLNLGGNAYGIEFSPNGQFLYATDNNIGANIFQYDLTASPIASSKTQIDPGSLYNKGGIQLAPDGKIYVAITGQPFLGVINSPNVAYPGCNYVDNGFLLLSGTLNSSAGGIPYFPASYNSTGGGISLSSMVNNILCNGGVGSVTVTPSGGSAPYTYVWTPTGQTTSTATGLSPGAYTITVTDAGGCSVIDTVLITQPTALSTTITSTNACGSSGIASVNVNGGTPGYTYLWSNGSSAGTITGLLPGNYSVTISDANGCTTSASVTIAFGSPPNASISASNTTVCSGSSVTLTASGGGSYSWNTGQTSVSIITMVTATTNYSVIVDSSGCTDTASITLTAVATPTGTISPSTSICYGNSLTLTAGGGGSYSWNTGAITSSIIVAPTATGAYSVIVSNGSCSDTASSTVTVLSSPSPIISGDTLLCTGDVTTLIASGGVSYSWSNGLTSSAIILNPTSTTSYTLIATDVNGCTATTTVNIAVTPPPNASVTNITICQGNTGILTATGGFNYSWSTGETTSSILVSSAGTYSVIVSTGSCSDTAVGTVVVNSNPVATILSNTTITAGQNVTLTASGGITYSWNNAQTGSVIIVSPTTTTYYCVMATDQNFCTDTACVTVTVEPVECSGDIFIPNAFSPNDDGMNDYFKIRYPDVSCIKELHIVIYNRWGEKVFESDQITFQWNGIYKSRKLDSSVFVYILEVHYKDGRQTIQKGNVSLIH